MKILWRRPTQSEIKLISEKKFRHLCEYMIVVGFVYFIAMIMPLIGIFSEYDEDSYNPRGGMIFLAMLVTILAFIAFSYIILVNKKYRKGEFLIIKGICQDKFIGENIFGGDGQGARCFFKVLPSGASETVDVRVDLEEFNSIEPKDEVLVACREIRGQYTTFWAFHIPVVDQTSVSESEEFADLDVRVAVEADIPGIIKLLYQVNQVHADGRPDLFKNGGIKYTEEDLIEKLGRQDEIILVAETFDESVASNERIKGYVFAKFEITEETTCLVPNKTLYIDDLCVDESARGRRVGTLLFKHAKGFAIANDFDRITLHVWECNPGAQKFYEHIGFEPLYTAMEVMIK